MSVPPQCVPDDSDSRMSLLSSILALENADCCMQAIPAFENAAMGGLQI